jgi:hypothetical protein
LSWDLRLGIAEMEENGNFNFEASRADRLQTAGRAGALVLLAGFGFDGGMFKLTATPAFWILWGL